MSALLVTDIASTQLAVKKPAKTFCEKSFPLAFDTLKILPFYKHEIDSRGSPIVPSNLKANQRFERKNEVAQYFSHFYAVNKDLANKLREYPIYNLNSIFEELAIYNPSCFAKQPFSYICNTVEFQKPYVATLIYTDPLAALSLITASGCGINSTDEYIREGALNSLTAIGKCTTHALTTSSNVNDSFSNNLSTLILTRNVLYSFKEKETNEKIIKAISEIDNELEAVEINATNRAIEHKKKLRLAS